MSSQYHLKQGCCAFLFLILFGDCLGVVRVNYSKCGAGGFTCVTLSNKNLELTYQCPSGTNDVAIYINQFSAPTNTERFIIKNCDKVTISTRCTGERKNIQSVSISNINTLVFQRLQFQSHLPPNVQIENVKYVETVPSFTFSQIDKSIHTAGCIIPKEDFKNLLVRNVTIDTVQSNAFYMPNAANRIKFSAVEFRRLQTSAINLKLDQKQGMFAMEKGKVGVVEHLAVMVTGRNVSFVENEFIEINSAGINGTAETFHFDNNSVNTMQPHGLSILATNVSMCFNSFEHLKSAALEKISPGLLEDSGRSFGALRFTYRFHGNRINFMDAGCLHPDVVAYESVPTEMDITENGLYCSCENSAWVTAETSRSQISPYLEDFHSTLMEEDGRNYCISSCNLPLHYVKMMIKDGKCDGTNTADRLCDTKDLSTSTESAFDSTVSPQFLRERSSSNEINFCNSLLLPIVFICILQVLLVCQ